MQEEIRITTIQTSLFWEDVSKNLRHFEERLRSIKNKTDIIVLPEMFTTGFSMVPSKLAETMDGDSVSWMKKMAFDLDTLLIGSLIIQDQDKYVNRLLVVYPDSSIQYYDKKHLFAMAGENHSYTAGSDKLIFDFKGWKICPLICYDLRFPVWSRNRNNYDVLIYVANWPEKRNNHWKVLLQARAIENQSYVVGVNRIGEDGNQYHYSGDTCIYDPMGQKISNTESYRESIETVILKKTELDKVRKSLPFALDSDNFIIV
jgi:omega-amidase